MTPPPAPALSSYDGAELERGLDILLTGLTATLTPGQGDSPRGPIPSPAEASRVVGGRRSGSGTGKRYRVALD